MSDAPHGFAWLVRHSIYDSFVTSGVAPSVDDLSDAHSRPVREVRAALRWLADEQHTIALAPGTTNVWMAWPFSAVPTPYPVRTPDRLYWANCAWDALSIPVMLGLDATVTTRCDDCGERLTLDIVAGELAPTDTVVHFAVPVRRFHDNVAFT